MNGKTGSNKFVADVATEVEKVRQHKEMRLEYMTLEMELKRREAIWREEGKAEGKAEGMFKATRAAIVKMMENLQFTMAQAMDVMNIPAEERAKYAATIQGGQA